MMKIGVFLILSVFFCTVKSDTLTNQLFIPTTAHETVFDTLIGILPQIIKKKKTPYLVPSNIEVPPDRTVTIEPGTVFLFKNFSGLHVRGKLLAHGTADEPIIFTSEYDKNYNAQTTREANPFDWDGIYMTSDAMGSQITHCCIFYSVYCISSATKFIRLEPLSVKENGKGIITIEDTEFPLSDSTFSYSIDKKDIIKNGIPIDLFSDPAAKKRTLFRILSSVVFAGGLGSGIYFISELDKANSNFDKLSSSDFDNLNKNESSDWKKAQDKTLTNKLLCSVSTLFTIAGLAGFSWTFTF